MPRRSCMPACAILALGLQACSVTPLSTTTATVEEMGEGTALVEDLSERWLIKGSAGHAGDGGRADAVWRIRYGRLELCDGAERSCREVGTDGVLPDTLVVPRGEPDETGAATQNAVWIRSLPQGAVRAGRGALAYCTAEGAAPTCHAATFSARRDVLRDVIAPIRLRQPQPRDVIWVSLSRTVARCEASVAAPEPRCIDATLIDPEIESE